MTAASRSCRAALKLRSRRARQGGRTEAPSLTIAGGPVSLALLRRRGEEPGMPLGIDRPIGPAVLDVLRRMNDFSARGFGDLVVLVDVIEVDEDTHRRCIGVARRLQAAFVRSLSHHHELALK